MVILITGASHAGKTLLAQSMLEKYKSHACFYSDATLLAAQSSGIDNMEHGISQLPYALIASVISVICFMIAGFIM